jgi:hypothetical protein
MNWYLKGKLAFLIAVFGSIFWAWFSEDILHLGVYNFFERSFGRENGFLLWYFFWLIIFWILFTFLRNLVSNKNPEWH